MKIVLTGPKGSGKSSVGAELGRLLGVEVIDTDSMIEALYAESGGERLSFREIYRAVGAEAFRQLERQAVARVAERDWCVVCTGGGTMLHGPSRRLLRPDAVWVLLSGPAEVLYQRATAAGVPANLDSADPAGDFAAKAETVVEAIEPLADFSVDVTAGDAGELAGRIAEELTAELAARVGNPNTLGQVIRLTTAGESHGRAYVAILDGVPAGIELSEADIQQELDRRRPGQSAVSTPRNEADTVQILSGTFEGRTTGASIGLYIGNRDHDSSRYEPLRRVFRPGHADFTYIKKYGLRDHRGGGRSSGRETAARVAGGAVAKKILAARGVRIVAFAQQIAGIDAEAARFDYEQIERNPVRTADPAVAEAMASAILSAKEEGDSVGGVVRLEVHGLPAGLGDPVFAKLDARLGGGFFSLGAVKGVEFGTGFGAAKLCGSEHNDALRDGRFVTNHAGGILGGISTGQAIVAKVAIKPTASISKQQQASDMDGRDIDLVVEGRHDPCIVPRVIPVLESMAALILLDAWEIQRRLHPGWEAQARS